MEPVALTDIQEEIAKLVAAARDAGAKEIGGVHTFGAGDHLLGARGEQAWAKIHNVFWTASVGSYKAPDFGHFTQVKAATGSWYSLSVPTDAKPHEIYWLVTSGGHPGTPGNKWICRGRITAREALLLPIKTAHPRGTYMCHVVEQHLLTKCSPECHFLLG